MSAADLDKLNPDQRRAVEHGVCEHGACDPATDTAPALLVIAGARSGKTSTLAHRVVHLAANGVDPRPEVPRQRPCEGRARLPTLGGKSTRPRRRIPRALDLIVPQRFYVHQQSRSGDRHLYASRTRFLPDALLMLFEQRTWPVRAQEPGHAAAGRPEARVDIAARLRARWR